MVPVFCGISGSYSTISIGDSMAWAAAEDTRVSLHNDSVPHGRILDNNRVW